ncbi:MAG TPA: FkbM family methyltransferase [Thermotogota bacterium]|nr:FkbM family methyltransferase [Thermotogota bacterium]
MIQNINYEGNIYSLHYHDDLINSLVSKYNNFFEYWVLEEVRNKIKSYDFTIDIGANVGNHSFYFKNICNAKRLIAFEPLLDNLDLLKLNCNNIEIQPYAISNINSIGNLMVPDLLNNSGIARISNSGNRVELKTLDFFNFKNVTFIKIDVEGHELQVLEGATKTINKYKPQLLIEIHNGINIVDILKYLPNYKYEKISYESHYLFTYAEQL